MVETAGLKVDLVNTSDYEMPEEFHSKLDKNMALKAACGTLIPREAESQNFIFF